MAKIEPKDLGKLFDGRLKELSRLLNRDASERSQALSRMTSLNAFGVAADKLFAQAVAIPPAPVGSWIRGAPLPAMLAAKRRLTVDVTPETLSDFGASYNISPSAFVGLAAAGLLLVNIRDWNPSAANAEESLAAYANADTFSFFPNLFERASEHIYFLDRLRDNLFNPLFANGGSLEKSFDEAGALDKAAQAAAGLSPYSELVRRAVFRGERPALAAVRWHWAYAQAVKRFSRQLDPEISGGLETAFRALISGSSQDEGGDYLELATRLRYCHLLTSAPISASFGGVYNLLLDGEAEFLQAVRSSGHLANYDLVEDRLLDTIRSLQLGRLSSDLDRRVPRRLRPMLCDAGIEVFVRYQGASYLRFYEDANNRKALISYVVDTDGLEERSNRLAVAIDAQLQKAVPDIKTVASLAEESQAIARVRGKRLKRLTRDHSGIEFPKPDLVSMATTPVYEANPKLANLLLAATKTADKHTSIGGAGDIERRTLWFPRVFRRPPH